MSSPSAREEYDHISTEELVRDYNKAREAGFDPGDIGSVDELVHRLERLLSKPPAEPSSE